jgi:hypothetical protein
LKGMTEYEAGIEVAQRKGSLAQRDGKECSE